MRLAGALVATPTMVPDKKGIYAWYFSPVPRRVPLRDYIQVGEWTLLYIGIAGHELGGKQTLRGRILRRHLEDHCATSTLRVSLGCLLADDLGLRMVRTMKGSLSFTDTEPLLTAWMLQHASVTWIENEQPWLIEAAAFAEFGHLLPLNIKDNKRNPFRVDLMKLRKACKSKTQMDQ